ncbi:M20 family metallopeptidase [Microbacterium paludicola]|uniref:M20 family metallopeptidase n=1 Tax=Microbacterium paludicola TaxID=300019 RepID=UPI001642D5FC|nr:M20 family metallopeptidase [Microbacterium paludicola]
MTMHTTPVDVRSIDEFLDAHADELIDLVRDLIAINSQIPPYGDEREIVAFLRSTLTRMGLDEDITIIGPTEERPSMIARMRGTGGGANLMLNGHIDTKPIGEARELWRKPPLEAIVEDGILYGLGATDMKGAVAAMIFAAYALRASGAALAGDLVLGLIADEEAGAQLGAKFVAPYVSDVDAILIGEPSGWEHDWQGIHLVSRGVCGFRVIVQGTQMHSSLSDRMPSVNASLKLADLMLRIGAELDLPFTPHPLGQVGPTLNTGVMIDGGTFFGVVPGRAEFACDLRTVPGQTREEVAEALDRWLDACRAADPELQVEYHFEEGLDWIPWSELDAEHPLVAATQRAAADVLGEAPPLSVFPGGTDAPWYSQLGIPTLPSFGPGVLTCAHGPNEYVSVNSIHQAAKMYARIALDFCSSPIDTDN